MSNVITFPKASNRWGTVTHWYLASDDRYDYHATIGVVELAMIDNWALECELGRAGWNWQ